MKVGDLKTLSKSLKIASEKSHYYKPKKTFDIYIKWVNQNLAWDKFQKGQEKISKGKRSRKSRLKRTTCCSKCFWVLGMSTCFPHLFNEQDRRLFFHENKIIWLPEGSFNPPFLVHLHLSNQKDDNTCTNTWKFFTAKTHVLSYLRSN